MSGDMADSERAAAFRNSEEDDSWCVTAFRPNNHWKALFDRFEIDPHRPDAIAHMAARLAVELSAVAPDRFPEFAFEQPDIKPRQKEFALWEQGYVTVDEMDRIYEERKDAARKAGRNSPVERPTVKEVAEKLFRKHANALSRDCTLREPLPDLAQQRDAAVRAWEEARKDGKPATRLEAHIDELNLAIAMHGRSSAESLEKGFYAVCPLADCPVCIRRDRRDQPFRVVFYDEKGEVRKCDMCCGEGEVRSPRTPGALRAAMANTALDPVERARDELLRLLAIGRWPPE